MPYGNDTEKSIGDGLSRAGAIISVKAFGLLLFLAKKLLVILKAILLKLAMVLGIKIFLIGTVAIVSGVLASGLLQGATDEEKRYRHESVAAIPMLWRGYLERHAPPWQLLEALDILSGKGGFGGRESAEALVPRAFRDNQGRVSLVSVWNGNYHYTYRTYTTTDEDGRTRTRTEVNITFVKDWQRLDAAIELKTGAVPTADDRELVLVMSGLADKPRDAAGAS